MVTFQAVHDEFEVRARSADGNERVWTRRSLEVSKSIADAAVHKQGFVSAVVTNVHGGNRSAPLYMVIDEEYGRKQRNSNRT